DVARERLGDGANPHDGVAVRCPARAGRGLAEAEHRGLAVAHRADHHAGYTDVDMEDRAVEAHDLVQELVLGACRRGEKARLGDQEADDELHVPCCAVHGPSPFAVSGYFAPTHTSLPMPSAWVKLVLRQLNRDSSAADVAA